MRPEPRYRFTSRADGDFRIDGDPAGLASRRAAISDRPWTWLRQVHGPRVVVVRQPGEHAGEDADASVTAVPGAALAVQIADCVPVVLLADGAVGVAHAGWRGLVAGVLEHAVEALRGVSPARSRVSAVVGPCIGPECYEFGVDDLAVVAARYGDRVRARTSHGAPALDLRAATDAALAAAGVEVSVEPMACTACAADRYFSHRARGEVERMTAVVWMEP